MIGHDLGSRVLATPPTLCVGGYRASIPSYSYSASRYSYSIEFLVIEDWLGHGRRIRVRVPLR